LLVVVGFVVNFSVGKLLRYLSMLTKNHCENFWHTNKSNSSS